jgi:hypothetical protein
MQKKPGVLQQANLLRTPLMISRRIHRSRRQTAI